MRSSSATHVVAHGLVRRFGDLTAVDGIDLDVGEGEIFGFLGPNGAGKSTTVRMLVTLLKPSAGSASVAGFDVASQPNEVRRRIGVALQDAAIDPLMTGNESLRLQAVMQGLGGRPGQQRVGELLERVGLTEAGDRRVGTYSGGMRRRLDLALALIHKPSVLFLDEPTTGLDPTSRQAVWEEVRSLNDEGTTVFLTTQYLEEADQLAGRIAIIDGGTIVREGDPAALKEAVGDPTLRLEVADPSRQEAAQGILARFGGERPARAGRIAIGLRGGTGSLASVIRALDEAGIAVGHVEVDSPSLDDVFADATGRRLEGAGS
ncbi:MAG: ATP-binding cassette domain-containing protein [Acidimicrobiales bacterium]|nr:ATP-binding cassette domain-containing protein [Acidimicrobiales bacterium]